MIDVSVVDLTVKLAKPASYAKICEVIKAAAEELLRLPKIKKLAQFANQAC